MDCDPSIHSVFLATQPPGRFMTTPGSHNDVYAGTCHRMFFANFVDGKDPKKCADNDGHNVRYAGLLAMAMHAGTTVAGLSHP